MVEKSFLAQRYARLRLDQIHVVGYSVAGEESVVQIPELDVCFDIGRCPYFALTSNYVCLTHGHMDHVAGIAYYCSQRSFQGMKPGTILVPREIAGAVDNMLRAWREVERQPTPYRVVAVEPGGDFVVRKDFLIRPLATHHGGLSLGYSLISVRNKLKPEYAGLTAPELIALRNSGVPITYRVEVPLATYLGDTTAGPVYEHPDVVNAEVLITECTFFEEEHRQRAKVGKHLHVDDLAEIIPRLKNKYIVLTHVSRRTSLRRARRHLRKRVGDEHMARVHFLMDFEGAANAGDVELPVPPADAAD